MKEGLGTNRDWDRDMETMEENRGQEMEPAKLSISLQTYRWSNSLRKTL